MATPKPSESRNLYAMDSLLIATSAVPTLYRISRSRINSTASNTRAKNGNHFFCFFFFCFFQRGVGGKREKRGGTSCSTAVRAGWTRRGGALVVNGFCKDVLQHAMEFAAMEAQALVRSRFEGSVGVIAMMRKLQGCDHRRLGFSAVAEGFCVGRRLPPARRFENTFVSDA